MKFTLTKFWQEQKFAESNIIGTSPTLASQMVRALHSQKFTARSRKLISLSIFGWHLLIIYNPSNTQ